MFQFPAFPSVKLCIHLTVTELFSAGFPHSDISGSMAICASPKLFAACHVLRRLPVPRHSPCALSCLTYFFFSETYFLQVSDRFVLECSSVNHFYFHRSFLHLLLSTRYLYSVFKVQLLVSFSCCRFCTTL